MPLLAGTRRYSGKIEDAADGIVSVSWRLNGGMLHMIANLDDEPRRGRPIAGEIIHASSEDVARSLVEAEELPPSSIVVSIGSERQDIVTTK